jgi:hypothetical protein
MVRRAQSSCAPNNIPLTLPNGSYMTVCFQLFLYVAKYQQVFRSTFINLEAASKCLHSTLFFFFRVSSFISWIQSKIQSGLVCNSWNRIQQLGTIPCYFKDSTQNTVSRNRTNVTCTVNHQFSLGRLVCDFHFSLSLPPFGLFNHPSCDPHTIELTVKVTLTFSRLQPDQVFGRKKGILPTNLPPSRRPPNLCENRWRPDLSISRN